MASKAATPNLVSFRRKLERLKGRFHGDLVDVLAKRPRGARKAANDDSAWKSVWSEFAQLADEFFAEAMNLGVEEAEAHLQRSAPPEIVDKLRETVRERVAAYEGVVNDNLRDDVEGWKYESEDPTRQAELDEMLDGRLGRYADALHPVAYEGLTVPTSDAGVLMVWVLDPGADNCDECPTIADNGPYCAPDDDVDGATPLPTYPGDGDTPCRSECHCELHFEETTWQQYVEDNDLAA